MAFGVLLCAKTCFGKLSAHLMATSRLKLPGQFDVVTLPDVPLLREDRPHSQYPQKKIRKRVQKFYETIHGKHTTDTHRWHDSHHPVKKKRYSKIARQLCLEVRVPGLWCLSDTTRHLDRLFCLFWYVFEWKSWVKTPSSRRRPPSRSLSWKDLTA